MPTVLSPDAVPGPESAGNGPEGPGQSTDPRRGHPTGDLAERDPSTTRTGSRVAEHDLVAVLQGDPLLVADRERLAPAPAELEERTALLDRKSTRLNSSP